MVDEASKAVVHRHKRMQCRSARSGNRNSRSRVSWIAGRTCARLRDKDGRDHLGFRYDAGVSNREFRESARGSIVSMAPVVAGGTLYMTSGYSGNAMPGNVLLAFTVDGK